VIVFGSEKSFLEAGIHKAAYGINHKNKSLKSGGKTKSQLREDSNVRRKNDGQTVRTLEVQN